MGKNHSGRVDQLRLEVAEANTPTHAGFEVRVRVNGEVLTAAGGGLGMDPYKVLVPDNRLVATDEPRTVPIGRCSCGDYGCGPTDVVIVREDDRVHWEWLPRAAENRAFVFAAATYGAEIARASADHSWETPERTAGRLVLANVDRERLRGLGLEPRSVGNDYRDPELFQVGLWMADDYQVFVTVPWRGRGPESLARAVCANLAGPVDNWDATWHAVKPSVTRPPAIGPSWRRFRRTFG
ncbi:hypothetical protein [Actinokineospora iranica]|uniref:Uncharacterized protein n=1 Tax=Actinokineospora iranica TaxID=1271860 RepID=A0A1G6U2G4_9PSEU|nr:hypothetical protein [Actinokineospora iranica]SDD35592.1 hypothetical protein SAMN05216174_11075 [Actinokineospora iranica]